MATFAAGAFQVHRAVTRLLDASAEDPLDDPEPELGPPSSKPLMQAGERPTSELRRIREMLAVSQMTLAKQLGTNQNKISRIELGKEPLPDPMRKAAMRLLTGRK